MNFNNLQGVYTFVPDYNCQEQPIDNQDLSLQWEALPSTSVVQPFSDQQSLCSLTDLLTDQDNNLPPSQSLSDLQELESVSIATKKNICYKLAFSQADRTYLLFVCRHC